MTEQENIYKIIETDSGPMISQSRISVYDVLEAEEKGKSFFEICLIYELYPIQVEVAQAYIQAHREILIEELREIQVKKQAREKYYRAIQAEIWARIDALPPDPIRQKILEIRAKQANSNGHSE